MVGACLVIVVVVNGRPAYATSPGPPGVVDSVGIRLVDLPDAAESDPRTRIYVVDHVHPGATITRSIEITTTATRDTTVTLYSAAASITDGSFAIADGRTANPLSSWATLSPSTVVVPALGAATTQLTLAVPDDAPSGEQYAVVWAEVSSAAPTVPGIRYVSRVGIRMYISVGSGAAPVTEFTVTGLNATRTAGDIPIVRATVTNTGERALDIRGSLILREGPDGLTAGPYPLAAGATVAIGASVVVGFELGRGLPPGPWHAVLEFSSGTVSRPLEGDLTFPGSGSAPARVAPPSRPVDTLPWLPALIVASAVVLAVAVALIYVRNRVGGRRVPL